MDVSTAVAERLEYLRGEIRAERISWGELYELQGLAEFSRAGSVDPLKLTDGKAVMTDVWAMLEETAPAGCDAVQDLYSWSLNYDAGKGPFTLFLDLIGWSEDEIGEPLYSLRDASLGYLELGKLADALTAYADRPHGVREYVDALTEAESR